MIVFVQGEPEDGHCIWYGVCGTDAETKKPVNCYYNGTAKPFKTQHALELYKEYCPDLYKGTQSHMLLSVISVMRMEQMRHTDKHTLKLLKV